MDAELSSLERKVALLIAHTHALRAANETLRGELAMLQEQNRTLAHRVQLASTRLDALLERLPEH